MPYSFDFSTLSIRTTLLLQQIQANPERPITKSTNPPDQCRDCGLDVDSEPKSDSTGLGGIVFGTAWWFIYSGMVLPCPLRWSLQCGFGWVEVSMTKKKLGLVGLGGLRFSDEEAQTSQCGTISVRNYIKLVRLDFTLRNWSSTSS